MQTVILFLNMYSVFLFAGSKAHDGQSKRALHRWTKACSAWSWTQAPSWETCGPQTTDETCRYSRSWRLCDNKCIVILLYQSALFSYPGLSLRGGGQGFPPATINVTPRLLLLENGRKIEPKVTPSCLIPHLLVVFTQQLGTLGDNPACHLLPSIIKISFDTCICTLRKIMV